MIRLYLKNYSEAERADLYNVLSIVSNYIAQGTEPCKDIDSALDYLAGYMDAMSEKQKVGVKQCQHV